MEILLAPAVALPALFVLGAAVGSFLNVCIYRLPLEKSILWPQRSYCGHCYQPIHWYDNIPLVSYWLLGGRCRTCGAPFSLRYFLIELLTALGFAGLFYLEVVANVRHLDAKVLGPDRFLTARLVFFGYHALLFCFLVVATFSDLDHLIIPLPLTLLGTALGLIGSMVWAWPWPYTPAEMGQWVARGLWRGGYFGLPLNEGLYPWPLWLPLPAVLQPGGNWLTGLATGGAGFLMGTVLLRSIRFFVGVGMGPEYMDPAAFPEDAPPPGLARRCVSWMQRVGGKALGLGDADLMMMAGSFLGWQPVLVAFVLGVGVGLLFGIAQVFQRGSHPFAYGPGLAVGVLVTSLAWPWIGPRVQPLFFDHFLMAVLGITCVAMAPLMVLGGYVIRLIRLIRR